MKRGIIVAGFGAVGKTYLANKYDNVIDVESCYYAYLETPTSPSELEKTKGDKSRTKNPEFPRNYFKAIMEAREKYDIVVTTMHWDLLKFYDDNKIEYYLAFPEQGLEEEYYNRCLNRGNTELFSNKIKGYITSWKEKLKEHKPIKILYLKKGEYLEDKLKQEGLL